MVCRKLDTYYVSGPGYILRKGPHICLLNIYMALEGSEQPVLLFISYKYALLKYSKSVSNFGGCVITALSTSGT